MICTIPDEYRVFSHSIGAYVEYRSALALGCLTLLHIIQSSVMPLHVQETVGVTGYRRY